MDTTCSRAFTKIGVRLHSVLIYAFCRLEFSWQDQHPAPLDDAQTFNDMSYAPDTEELRARAMGDLRIGLPIVLSSDDASLAVLSAESASDERIAAAIGQGDATLVLTERRASVLKARIYDGDIARIRIPHAVKVSWVRAVADPTTDLDFPLKGPLTSLRGGSVHLCCEGVNLARRARLLPAVLTWPLTATDSCIRASSLTHVKVGDKQLTSCEVGLSKAVSASLPTAVHVDSRIHIFRVADGSEDHCAVIFGQLTPRYPVLVRLHSACLTGDVLGSLKCDCGKQLQAAMAKFQEAGSGVLLYLNQEGRGIGLLNKIRAYGLQDQGFDTVEANHRLGFEDDERNFSIGASILHQLGLTKVRLMTNNPAKQELLQSQGINVVERIPLVVSCNPFNESYLAVKAAKSGHIL